MIKKKKRIHANLRLRSTVDLHHVIRISWGWGKMLKWRLEAPFRLSDPNEKVLISPCSVRGGKLVAEQAVSEVIKCFMHTALPLQVHGILSRQNNNLWEIHRNAA